MPVNDARRFIHLIPENNGLRDMLNRCENYDEIQTLLGKNGFEFNSDEFVEAWNSEVVNSQTKECHDEFNDLRMWWELLNRF
ncbi:MAG: Nif11-like leader peptide family natural product precursor [Desulfobacterium sp.]